MFRLNKLTNIFTKIIPNNKRFYYFNKYNKGLDLESSYHSSTISIIGDDSVLSSYISKVLKKNGCYGRINQYYTPKKYTDADYLYKIPNLNESSVKKIIEVTTIDNNCKHYQPSDNLFFTPSESLFNEILHNFIAYRTQISDYNYMDGFEGLIDSSDIIIGYSPVMKDIIKSTKSVIVNTKFINMSIPVRAMFCWSGSDDEYEELIKDLSKFSSNKYKLSFDIVNSKFYNNLWKIMYDDPINQDFMKSFSKSRLVNCYGELKLMLKYDDCEYWTPKDFADYRDLIINDAELFFNDLELLHNIKYVAGIKFYPNDKINITQPDTKDKIFREKEGKLIFSIGDQIVSGLSISKDTSQFDYNIESVDCLINTLKKYGMNCTEEDYYNEQKNVRDKYVNEIRNLSLTF